MNRNMTRNEAKADLRRRILTTVAVMAFLAMILVALAITAKPEEPKTQERYYDAFDIYGDVKGAVEAVQVVYEMEVAP